MATFISNFDSEDVETMQAAQSTIPVTSASREKAEQAFDNMFEDTTKTFNKMFSEVWR